MPSEVVLTIVRASVAAAASDCQPTATTLAPKWSRSVPARLAVRFATRTSGHPSAISAATTARAAPPAPSTSAGPAAALQPGASCRRLAMKP